MKKAPMSGAFFHDFFYKSFLPIEGELERVFIFPCS